MGQTERPTAEKDDQSPDLVRLPPQPVLPGAFAYHTSSHDSSTVQRVKGPVLSTISSLSNPEKDMPLASVVSSSPSTEPIVTQGGKEEWAGRRFNNPARTARRKRLLETPTKKQVIPSLGPGDNQEDADMSQNLPGAVQVVGDKEQGDSARWDSVKDSHTWHSQVVVATEVASHEEDVVATVAVSNKEDVVDAVVVSNEEVVEQQRLPNKVCGLSRRTMGLALLVLMVVVGVVIGIVVSLGGDGGEDSPSTTSSSPRSMSFSPSPLPTLRLSTSPTLRVTSSPTLQLLEDWEFCTAHAQCANGCCSRQYSDDQQLKCTPLDDGEFNPDICIVD